MLTHKTGRCSLHVAVLLENEEIVEFIANTFRQTLRVGDNVSANKFFLFSPSNNLFYHFCFIFSWKEQRFTIPWG
jgi:hypothetical protein